MPVTCMTDWLRSIDYIRKHARLVLLHREVMASPPSTPQNQIMQPAVAPPAHNLPNPEETPIPQTSPLNPCTPDHVRPGLVSSSVATSLLPAFDGVAGTLNL